MIPYASDCDRRFRWRAVGQEDIRKNAARARAVGKCADEGERLSRLVQNLLEVTAWVGRGACEKELYPLEEVARQCARAHSRNRCRTNCENGFTRGLAAGSHDAILVEQC